MKHVYYVARIRCVNSLVIEFRAFVKEAIK
jgi:hypothetical protein